MRANPASWKIRVASLLLGVMPLCFALSQHIKVLPMALLFIAGLTLLITRTDIRLSYRTAWPVLAVCLLRLLYDIGNFLGHQLSWPTLDLPAQTLLFVAVAAVFGMTLQRRVVAIGFSLTAVLLGITCLVQRHVLGIDRPYGLNGGEWAAIEFAMFLLVLTLLAMLQALRPQTPRFDRWLHATAVVVGLYGSVLTQSRGPLLAFAPVFLALMLWFAFRFRRWRQTLVLLAATVIGMLAATATLHREMVDRLAEVPAEVASYGTGNTTGAVHERLEMWHAAWQAFSEHPLAGIGLDQFGTYVQAQARAGEVSPAIAKYVHPHSEYLESMVAGGLPALLVLLLFFAVPLCFFARHLNHAREAVSVDAMAGIIVVGMYGLCAFSDNVFYRAMPQSLYLFLVLGLSASIGKQLNDNPTH